jgi:mannobiose 2-epimerase
MRERLERYRKEMEQELEAILSYWITFTIDTENGGFVGKIDHSNTIHAEAPKGSVLNSRILWTFSAAYNLTGKQEYLSIAERSFQYLTGYFIDKEFGGVYWTVDYKGQPLDTKKQIYALSFAVYGLSEFYHASKNEKALQAAVDIYSDIVKHSYDEKNGGYIEALTRDWKEMGDLRLSAKDANEKKSMNTHLHVLEAFVNLYRVYPNEILKEQVKELICLFSDHIISQQTDHLVLFFDDEWNERSGVISYGHDIEAAWLVQEAAETIDDKLLLLKIKNRSLALAKAAAKGLDEDGGLWYEYDPEHHHLIKQKHSWPQAEAMIGFFNAWQNTGDEKYLKQSLQSWEFVKKYIHDKNCGEWYWGVNEDYSPMNKEDKAGIWKCPYHNTRACIEIINRINSLID